MYYGIEGNKEDIGGERQRKVIEGKERKMSGMNMNVGNRVTNR